jgi:hypothetical protein
VLKKILNETAYYGEAYACRRQVVKVRVGDRMVRKGVAQPRSEWVRYPAGVVPAIIDRDTFEAAAATRMANRRYSARRCMAP